MTDTAPAVGLVARTHVHTFSNGSVVVLRNSLPVRMLIRTGAWSPEMLTRWGQAQAGELVNPVEAMELEGYIIAAMWVDPKVAPPDREPLDGERNLDDIDDLEISETIDLLKGEAADGERFPGVGAVGAGSVGSGGSGANVGNGAKPAARPRAGKSGGVARGSDAGAAPHRPRAKPRR